MRYDMDSIGGGFLREGASSYMDASMATDRELLSALASDEADKDRIDSVMDAMFSSGDVDLRMDSLDISDRFRVGIKAAIELGRRACGRNGRVVVSPDDVYKEVRHFAFDNRQERMIVVLLNGAHEVMRALVATQGLLNRTIAHPREIYSDAIKERAAAIAIAHNHPSGCIEPSNEDKEVTRRLSEAGNILGIKLLDHLIITPDRYYSFLEHGLI